MKSLNSVTPLGVALAAALFPMVAPAATGTYQIFRSPDRGQSWVRADSGLPRNARINALAETRGSIVAGTDAGIYISRDSGVTWTGSGTSAGRVLALADTGTAVFAGTDRSGILVSRDGGVTWAVNEQTRFGKVRALLASADGVYAGTDTQGVFVSRDGGYAWTSISEGLPAGAQIFSLAGLKGQVFAGLYGKGLYTRSGQTEAWRKVGNVSPLALAATGETVMAGHNPGGIFWSDSIGASWEAGEIAASVDLGKAPVWEMAASPELAIAGVSSGIYLSTDRGRHWMRARTGLPVASSGIAFLAGRRFLLAAVFIPTRE